MTTTHITNLKKLTKLKYPIARRFLAMQRYGRGSLYTVLPLNMQRDYFQIQTHDQLITKTQLYVVCIGPIYSKWDTQTN